MRGCSQGSAMGGQAHKTPSSALARTSASMRKKNDKKEKQRRITTAKSLQSTTIDEWGDEKRTRITGRGKGEGGGEGGWLTHRAATYTGQVQQGASHSGELPRPRSLNACGHGERKTNKKNAESRSYTSRQTQTDAGRNGQRKGKTERKTRDRTIYRCIHAHIYRGARHGVYCTAEAS